MQQLVAEGVDGFHPALCILNQKHAEPSGMVAIHGLGYAERFLPARLCPNSSGRNQESQ